MAIVHFVNYKRGTQSHSVINTGDKATVATIIILGIAFDQAYWHSILIQVLKMT